MADDGPSAAVEDPDEPLPKPRPRRAKGLLPAPVRQVGRLLIIALIVEYLLVPQIAGTRKAIHQLAEVRPIWLLLGVVLEAASIFTYALLARDLLPHDDHRPKLLTVLRIQLTTLSVSHCVPGGSAAGSSLGYRLFTVAGVGGADAAFTVALQGLGSAVVLNAIFWSALVASIPVWGFSPLYILAGVIGGALLILLALLLFLFTRDEDVAAAWIERRAKRIPFVDSQALSGSYIRVAFRLRLLGQQRRVLAWALLWATANWVLDAASLYVFVGAFGHWVNPDGLLVAYGLANVLAAIPLTPGGLGVVEATLTSALVGFDTPRSIALLGVVSYRLINFWLPIPVGGIAYASLQVDPGHPEGAPGRFGRMRARLPHGRP